MLTHFLEHTRCPAAFAKAHLERSGTACSPESPRHFDHSVWERRCAKAEELLKFKEQLQLCLNSRNGAVTSQETNLLLDILRLERYIDNRIPAPGCNSLKSAARSIYYRVRPVLPVVLRSQLQRFALRDWQNVCFPSWPVDFTADDIIQKVMRQILESGNVQELPFIWYWPEGKSGACIMTHDVETREGRDFCGEMMKMEAEFGLVSSFEVVPEVRYEVPGEFLEMIRQRGCEVCVHGLNHDGHLFSSEAVFRQRAPKINEYAKAWKAVGFRSPVMYRNLEWYGLLDFSYDMSVPNVGHLDPQRGGCCTVMPYFIGNMLELPLTTTQDYPLYKIVNQRSLDLWRRQSKLILARNGLISFIIHPDYTVSAWAQRLYRGLLELLSELRGQHNVWMPLPREIDSWWRQRRQMELCWEDGGWVVRGPEAHRARVAYASLEEGAVRYHVERRRTCGQAVVR